MNLLTLLSSCLRNCYGAGLPAEGGEGVRSQKEQVFLFYLLNQSTVQEVVSARARGAGFP